MIVIFGYRGQKLKNPHHSRYKFFLGKLVANFVLGIKIYFQKIGTIFGIRKTRIENEIVIVKKKGVTDTNDQIEATDIVAGLHHPRKSGGIQGAGPAHLVWIDLVARKGETNMMMMKIIESNQD